MTPPKLRSSDYVIQTLAWARKNGFSPVPLTPNSKAAISAHYVKPDYKPPDDDFWCRGEYGVGMVTGLSNGGLVDIDLDCNAAVFFARRFLPKTPAVFGRVSKRDSHYLYRVKTEMQKRAFINPLTGSTILEIRADGGHQTVFPGSIHPSGELIEWSKETFPAVPEIDGDVLLVSCKKAVIATLVSEIWSEGQRNEVNKLVSGVFYHLEWAEDDADFLLEAVRDYMGDDDKTRRLTLRNTYIRGERGGKVAGAGKLREFLKDDRLVDHILNLVGSPTANVLQEYNEKYAVVMLNNRFRVARTDGPAGKPPSFYQRDDFLNWKSWDTIDLGLPKPMSKAKLWLSNARHRSYDEVDFLPGVDDPPNVLNLWNGWAVQPREGRCDAWMELLTDYICGGDSVLVRWMLHWFANIVREPMNKPLTAPVIVGHPGAGKSLLFSYFGRILGSSFCVVTNPEQVHGKFNDHLAYTLLLHSDEAVYAEDKKHRSMLKSMITDDFRMYEPKGVDAKQIRNFLRIGITSNYQNAAPVEIMDRRFTVNDMGDRSIRGKPIVQRLLQERDDGGPSALFHFLTTMDYDSDLVRSNVKNEHLSVMKYNNLDPMASWWQEVLSNGAILPKSLSWAAKPDGEGWSPVVSSTALYMSMEMDLRKRARAAIPNRMMFANNLDRYVGKKLSRVRMTFSNDSTQDDPPEVRQMSDKQMAIMNMPDLDDCREAFSKYLGQEVQWPGEREDEDWREKRKREKEKKNERRPDF